MAWQPSTFQPETFQPDTASSVQHRVARTTMMGRLPRATMPNFGEASAAALPYAGGMAGGLLGAAAAPVTGGASIPIAASLGAGIGGAGGEALRQLWEHAMSSVDPASGVRGPQSPQEAAGRISRASVEQGAGELVGRGIAEGASRLAVPLARAGIKASATATRRAAAARGEPEPDFHAMARTMIEERIPTAGSAGRRLREASLETEKRIAASVARGEKVSVADMAQAMIRESERVGGRRLTASERTAMMMRAKQAINDVLAEAKFTEPGNQTYFTAAEARQIKKQFQDQAKPEYAAAGKFAGRAPSKSEAKVLAEGAREAVDRIADTAKPDARTQQIGLLFDALSNTEAGLHPTMLQYLLGAGAGAGGFAGHGAGGAAVAAPLAMMLGSPSGMRWSAHAMTDPTVQWLLQQTPRSALFGLDRLNEGNR